MKTMKWQPVAAVFLGCMCAFQAAMAQPELEPHEAVDTYIFAPTGLPRGDAQAILPAGAVLHLQINRLDRMVGDLSDLAMTFLPDKTLPPQYAELLSQPQPLVQLLTASAMGMPMDANGVSAMLGIDFARPVTLTFYPMPLDQGFVLGMPVRDVEAFSMFLMNVLAPVHVELVEFNGVRAHTVVSGDPSFPEMLVLCSEDTAYLCASNDLAQALIATPAAHRLAATPFLPKALAQRADADLIVAFDGMLLKGFAGQLAQHRTLPPNADLVEMMREEWMNVSPDVRANVDMMLSRHVGIADADQAMAIASVVMRESYEAIVGVLASHLQAFDGIVVSVDLSGQQQTLSLAAYSKSIEVTGGGAPLSMPAIKAAVARLPHAADYFSAIGQQPAPSKSVWVGGLLERIESRLVQENLPAGFFQAVRRYHETVEHTAPLESRTPWMVRTQATAPIPAPDDFATVSDFVNAITEVISQGQSVDSLAVMPRGSGPLLEAHYAALAAVANNNENASRRLMRDLGFGHEWYDLTSRTTSDVLEGSVNRITMENSYVTRGGWFGFNEHELINRRFTLYHQADDFLYVHEGGRDPARLLALAGAAPSPLPETLAESLDALPEDVRRVESLRVLHRLNNLIDWLADIETLAHRELDAYLARMQQISDGPGTDDAKIQAMLELELPILLQTLKIDNQGKVYALLPGDIPFPRRKVAGHLVELMNEFRAGSVNLGGTIAFQRRSPGEWEGTLVHNTESLALLVKSVVNNFYEQYASSPQAQQAFKSLFSTPRDETHQFDYVILKNELWSFIHADD